jgi:drug/metabolite transporter (DMT)-like permease
MSSSASSAGRALDPTLLLPLIAVSTLMWGVAPLLESRLHGVHIVTVMVLLAAVVAVAALPVVLLYAGVLRRELPTLLTHNRRLVYYAVGAAIVNLVATVAYLQSIRGSGGGGVNMLVVAASCCYPVVTALAAWLLYGHAVDALGWTGIAITGVGLTLLVLGGHTRPHGEAPPPGGR